MFRGDDFNRGLYYAKTYIRRRQYPTRNEEVAGAGDAAEDGRPHVSVRGGGAERLERSHRDDHGVGRSYARGSESSVATTSTEDFTVMQRIDINGRSLSQHCHWGLMHILPLGSIRVLRPVGESMSVFNTASVVKREVRGWRELGGSTRMPARCLLRRKPRRP